ncbi:MAG: aminotransferase class V-fold PLP-dependent enzyme [Candidatus Caenarcaniphilales bacterium]|nr:aminotransferase class V-fold PLP-dependent enzyme [Candidatus Caenarcaniphilales bacterium]
MHLTFDVAIDGIIKKRNPFQVKSNDFFENTEILKSLFAKLINCNDSQRIAIIPSVSYGMSTIARNINLQKNQNVVIAGEQFPSNVYPWQRLVDEKQGFLKIISPKEELPNLTEIWNQEILEVIDENTRLVALSHVHWMYGSKFNLEEISKKCKKVNAFLVLDLTQSLGALPFDLNQYPADAIVCAGYKWLLGPYSIGMAYYSSSFDEAKPLEDNWINRMNSRDFGNLTNFTDQYKPSANRFCVGESSNFILLPMMIEALKLILKLDPSNIQKYCGELINNLTAETESLERLNLTIESSKYRSNHLLSLKFSEDADIEKVQKTLISNKVITSVRGKRIRISPNVYNDISDIEALKRVLFTQLKEISC